MSPLGHLLCFTVVLQLAKAAPANGFVFPDERKKSEPVITPPVLPVLEHLERDPSTLLSHERKSRPQVLNRGGAPSKPRLGFGGGFSVAPSGNGGLTASVSSSGSGAGASHSASQSFSFGLGQGQGFSASHSGSQSSSFNGFGSGLSSSQSSSQAASFSGSGSSLSAASSSAAAAALAGGGNAASQSASSAFGFNSIGDLTPPNDEVNFGDGLLDIRHRGAPDFLFPNLGGRSKVGAAAFRTKGRPSQRNGNDWLSILVSD